MSDKQIDKKVELIPFKGNITTYYFKYKFRNMPYLVCDKFGNFFILSNCKNNRTTEFKQLDNSKGYIYYNRNMIRMSTLRIRAIESQFRIVINYE